LNIYLKFKKFNIGLPKSFFDAAIDDTMNTLCFDTEFHKFEKENYASSINYDKIKQRLISINFKLTNLLH
jgi:hypothetical protein